MGDQQRQQQQDMGDLFRQRRNMANPRVNAVFDNKGSTTAGSLTAAPASGSTTGARPSGGGGGRNPQHHHNSNTNHNNNAHRQNNHHKQHQQQVLSYPIEQGCLCSLKENFGFIRCANRDEEIFFHYSELLASNPADLQMDQEVEFRVGPDSKTGERNAAYQVKILEPGTVVWETPEYEGLPQRGIVERKPGRGGSGVDGTIRLMVDDKAEGPRIKYTGDQRLGRGDLVECVVMKQKSNGLLYAKDTKIIMSDRERQEKLLLENATVEEGVVVALRGEYGFLRSSSRRDEIYFHYSAVDLGSTEGNGTGEELVLREGQDMKFLVIKEDDDGRGGRPEQARRISARRVQLKPRGSVVFDEVIARGVTGVVTEVPHCVDSSHRLEQHGKVLLDFPITAKKFELGEEVEGTRTIAEVFLSPQDSPGGRFSFNNGESVGLYVERGDKLLFDVSVDFCDGACRATPTRYLTPPKTDEKADKTDRDTASAVRLIAMSLAGRSEGTVSALKEGYGFIHFVERSVDVHFRMFQMLPDNLQDDLRRNMGFANTDELGQPLRLEIGANVQFDISIRGKISGHTRTARGNAKGLERENLKAQRILLLPPNSVTRFITVEKDVRGRVTKQEMLQPFVGIVELEKEIELSATLELRHPLVAKLLKSYLDAVDNRGKDNVPPILFHDSLSAKEEEVACKMMDSLGGGRLMSSHVTESGVMGQRLRIEAKGVDADSDKNAVDQSSENDHSANQNDGDGKEEETTASPKRPAKGKPIKLARFDKQSFTDEKLNGSPPSIDDAVMCDVRLCRKSGNCHVGNIRITEAFVAQLTLSGESDVGYIKEILLSKQYGYIASTGGEKKEKEPILFRFADVAGDPKKTSMMKRGDNVKFEIATDQLGKKVAAKIEIVPGETTIIAKPEKDACKGIVLLPPSNNTAKNATKRKVTSTKAEVKNTRWTKVDLDDDNADALSTNELGCILLIEEPKHSDTKASVATVLRYRSTDLAHRGGGGNGLVGDVPRRGDLVFFQQKQDNSPRDVRLLRKAGAEAVRGTVLTLEEVDDGIKGSFVADDSKDTFSFDGDDVVGCDVNQLKAADKVEGIVHNGKIFGVSRLVDLYVDSSTLGSGGNKGRPKLNLTVKKDRGGTIMAQSMMAKGPDGTSGFAPGWTTRTSLVLKVVPADLSFVAKEFVPCAEGAA